MPFPFAMGPTQIPGLSLFYNVTATNVGHSVAEAVVTSDDLYFAPFEQNKWFDMVMNEERGWCKRATDPKAPSIMLFPSRKYTWNSSITVRAPDAGSSAALIICLDYSDASNVHYQTQAWAQLQEGNAFIIPSSTASNAPVLKLIREPLGDQAY
jgi:hypothetical protein